VEAGAEGVSCVTSRTRSREDAVANIGLAAAAKVAGPFSRDNRTMFWMFVFLGIALVAAVVVFLFASVVTRIDDRNDRTGPPVGLKGFWRDFVSGLTSWRRSRRDEHAGRSTVEPVDTGMDEFFAATEVDDPAYIDADEITDVLHRARERATHTLHSAGVRRPATGAVPSVPSATPPGRPPVLPQD